MNEQRRRECNAKLVAYLAWFDAHPGACRECDATGKVSVSENLGPTGEVWLCHSEEDCPKCLGQGKCPACGGEAE